MVVVPNESRDLERDAESLPTICGGALAWALFADAQRAAPDDPALSHLEIVMMLGQGRHAAAQERARFWVAKLQRRHDRE